MAERSRSLESACLQDLRAALAGGAPGDAAPCLEAIVAGGFVEEACELLRSSRREAGNLTLLEACTARLGPLAAMAQQQRSARWQLDGRRALVRFRYAKEEAALDFDDGDLHAIFLHALRLEGFRLALDLGKRPRALLQPGPPLPAGAGGVAEAMDVVLAQEPVEASAEMMARLNRRLPAGLRVHQWLNLPTYASPLGDLAILSHWRWEVSVALKDLARDRVSAFLAASHWLWDRGAGKTDGPLDLRALVVELHWEEDCLRFATLMEALPALNPLKLLGAILGVEPPRITGLVRIAVDLKPDPRLGQADRFQPKLKNMYEDAVLLEGGSNIVLVDEDDEDPIQLGG
jgi:hypothetical protein